ncbi:DUF397 domain-containing protein [Streptomyces sp. BI20]|uniref:DUF397 domain-containing protein n=1 Tax=Streptomyces sp. BI20 TaxID=3403460 RepID=UPI003C70CF16
MAVQRATCSGQWFKSFYSGEGGSDCVETRMGTDSVAVRDSKCLGASAYDVVTVSAASWEVFARYVVL